MKTKKKLLSLFLVFGLILGLMPMTAMTAMAENETESWVKHAAESFAGGSGTKEDPYQISTAEQLAKLAKDVNDGVYGMTHRGEYFKLTAAINLSGKRWEPIGYGSAISSKPFSGYFDGNNKEITGLYVDERGNNTCAGLFGAVTSASIENVKIVGAQIYAGNETNDNTSNGGTQYGAGVLIGSATETGGSGAQSMSIKACNVSGQVNSKMYAGGLIGTGSYCEISNCTADVAVTGNTCSGGFAGIVFRSTLSNNEAKGTVTSTGWSTGGFVGQVTEGSIKNCSASGNVKADDWNLGGFAGYLWNYESTVEIKNCIASGDVTSTLKGANPKAGGFVGTNYGGNIQNSHTTGTVAGSNQYGTAGGFVASDENGTTVGCSFDRTKNPKLNGIGGTVTAGSNDIKGKETNDVLADICNDYFGGHKYSKEWTVDKKATCKNEGSKSHHCERCQDKKDVTPIEKKSHTLVKTDAKKATHLTEGNIAYWRCSSCKKYFSDAAGTKEISLADTVIAKTKTHKEDGTGWHSDTSNHWKTCECGKVLNKAAHTKKTTITKKATFTENGKSVTKCTTCGKTLATTTIPKVSKVTLSTTSYTYNGNAKNPGVTVKDSKGTTLKRDTDYTVTYDKGRKSIGKYTVKITLKGKYSGTKNITFTIRPKNTSLTAISGQKKAFTVKWKKQTTQTNGYQIQYATKKDFSNAKIVTVKSNSTTTKKITGCASNKKYYVRIRTYKDVKVNGKTTRIGSNWSEYMTVKTK